MKNNPHKIKTKFPNFKITLPFIFLESFKIKVIVELKLYPNQFMITFIFWMLDKRKYK